MSPDPWKCRTPGQLPGKLTDPQVGDSWPKPILEVEGSTADALPPQIRVTIHLDVFTGLL